MQTGKKLFKN